MSEVRVRFWEKVLIGDGCWEWCACRNSRGYGVFTENLRNIMAHRWSYEDIVGEIPDGLEMDHLCRNPACVRPDHLEPVTHRENMLRGFGASGLNARKTHCSNGHEFNDKNTRIKKDGSRFCRVCDRNAKKRKYWEKKNES